MTDNLINNPSNNSNNDSFTISLDGIEVPLTNVVYSNLDFKKNSKIEIFYTRSYRDYFRSILFLLIRLLIIGGTIFCLFYYISLYITIPNNTIPSSYNFSQTKNDPNDFFNNIRNSI